VSTSQDHTPGAGAPVVPSLAGRGMSGAMVLLFAVAVGQAVASNYLAQPLLETLRDVFGVSEAVAGLIVTAAQVGYAAGLILLVPLGDLFERRRTVVTLAVITATGLAVAAFAPSIGVFIAATGVIGLTSTMAQLLVPFAATLAPEAARGRVVGNVMSGLILGILLARTFSGLIAQAAGWRTVYVIAAVLMAAQAVLLYVKLPTFRQSAGLPYHRLLASIGRIARDEPVLRRRALYGVFSFATFSVLWTTLAFLLSAPPFDYSDGIIGLFGLVGAAGALGASLTGRYTDRGWGYWLTGIGCIATLLSFVTLWFGRASLPLLIAGILILDVGSQGIHISNQSEIYRLRPAARNRINAFYMTSCFIGASLGSASAAFAYDHWQWAGTCWLGGLLGAACVLRWATDRQRPAGDLEPYCEADPPA
jgi:predicted MFS family arabinose efflux permease